MKPGPLLRGSPRLTATARTPRHTAARALLARAQPSASALQPSTHRARNSLPQPCTNSQHIAHPFQHLPSIPSHGIARALPCARARLSGHVPPRRNVGLPRPRLAEAQPCLSTCALPVRQSASVLMLRVRSQCAGHDSMYPVSCARWDGGHMFTRNAHRRRLSCAATPGCTRTSLMCCQQSYSSPLLACSAGSMSSAALQAHMYCRHTCIAAHLGQMQCCCGFVLSPARAGLGWTPPLNGCSQGLVVRGISPPEPCLYTCHTTVFSKVSNSLPIHQYFPAASPYGAQPGGWIGNG